MAVHFSSSILYVVIIITRYNWTIGRRNEICRQIKRNVSQL